MSTVNPIQAISSQSLLDKDNNYNRAPTTIEEENKFLEKVDKYIVEKQAKLHEKSKFENLTFREFVDNLYKVLYEIIEDISKLKVKKDNDINTENHRNFIWIMFL